mmetsp:Transcript_16314/g.35664  ORF Transcript_16314/g.35664 Transcript_16314/m.35664 type:complete len:215 (+) Transcript_16314:1521-2165(+)
MGIPRSAGAAAAGTVAPVAPAVEKESLCRPCSWSCFTLSRASFVRCTILFQSCGRSFACSTCLACSSVPSFCKCERARTSKSLVSSCSGRFDDRRRTSKSWSSWPLSSRSDGEEAWAASTMTTAYSRNRVSTSKQSCSIRAQNVRKESKLRAAMDCASCICCPSPPPPPPPPPPPGLADAALDPAPPSPSSSFGGGDGCREDWDAFWPASSWTT